MNDIAIHTKQHADESDKQHQERYAKLTHHVLNKLEAKDLYLKLEKCAFAQKKIDYLEVIIEKGKLWMDPKKLKGVENWPQSKTVTEVCLFLVFTGYYQYFVPKYSKIV